MSDGGSVVPEYFALVTYESLIDSGRGTPEMAAWLDEQNAKRRAAWLALPFYVRWWRTLQHRAYEPRRRLANVFAAVRGEWEASDDE